MCRASDCNDIGDAAKLPAVARDIPPKLYELERKEREGQKTLVVCVFKMS